MNNHIYLQLISLNKNDTDHYLRRYVKLVSFYKERNWSKQFGFHEHHIIPESFGGPDTNENLVFITIREHFILHHLLYKAFPKSTMVTAFFSMCNGFGHYSGNKITSRVYQNVMLEFIERQSETSRERQNKLVEEGKHPWQDKEKASKRVNKLVAERRHNFSGPESNRKQLENGTHPSQIKLECEHCKRTFDEANYSRWHGNKCKLNPLYIDERKPQPKIECPHCKREFNKGNYTKSHGDKCKL